MKICVAQTRPIKGDIQSNIDNHKKLIDLAVSNGADTVIFPELSLTGYEPELSKELATDQEDSRFDNFQKISNTNKITIGIGVPLKDNAGTCISMVLFQPHKARQTYSKKYLHPDEEEFFISGESSAGLPGNKPNIALAICYELSVPEHSENAYKSGAEIYIASVAKSADGVEKAIKTLSDIATKYSMTVLMSNCVGLCDGFECGGKTSIWNNKSLLAGQLNDTDEGILIIDTETRELIEKTTNRFMIFKCEQNDFNEIYEIINDAASAYRGIIPADRWHEPYMTVEELKKQIAEGVEFWSYTEDDKIIGVMGIQFKKDVTLIRHAYTRTTERKKGTGSKLLEHLRTIATKPVLIGTWADAKWAIEFYQKHGFRLLPEEEKNNLLRKYWTIPARQIETSVVLASSNWDSKV